MAVYFRKVQYHETDKMGITHHSNYIRWMEEARVFFMDEVGYGYKKMEEDGVVSPVIAIDCQYKTPTTFDDMVRIDVGVAEFRGVKLVMKYEMTNDKTGDVVLVGKSEHCFLGEDGKPVALKKKLPEIDRLLRELAEGGK
ncbi:MAG: acyl-CoA thioesterase [Clostridiales bacterium]|nr:acyl-CoA thioesterase [Clostridiales bacterium]